jgi:CBS domain-containing protein
MHEPATNILVQAAAAFLQHYPPFAQMSPQCVAVVATQLKLAYYPMHTTLLDPAQGPGTTFFIIQRGRVESRRSQGDELFEPSIQALGVGECFPISALLGRRASRNTYRTLEDTFCYTLTAAEFLNLFEEDTVFRDFCTNHLSMLLNQAERVRQGEYVQLVTAQQPWSAPLTTLLKREPIACLPSTALEIVLEKMASLNIGAVVIVN